ncbi:MAG TPA: nuclear transport factor 2 family protein, partial [Phnomibacter sp.]|nr:nuclear transport factor 2 family protein [Phnomibacter sp.]
MFFCLALLATARAQTNPVALHDTLQLKQLLLTQQQAWNRGDIPAFMQGYWNSDSLVFTGSSGPVYGWQNTLNRYLKAYDSPAKMGTLNFGFLRWYPLGTDHYMLLGTWHLTREAGNVGGFFTLIFRRFANGW